MLCWKVYLRIDRAYGLAGNKVGKVCSRKSFGRQDKLLAVLPAVSFQALPDYAVPEIGRVLEEYGELLVAAQEAARVTELLRALGAGADELRKVSSMWGIAIHNASGRLSLTTLSAAQTKLPCNSGSTNIRAFAACRPSQRCTA